jgi:hypothetical protein
LHRHRIGQTKVVSVYRLITKGTYEQTMYERANFKLGLEQAIIGRGDYAAQTTAGAADDEGGGSTSVKAKGGKVKEAERAAELDRAIRDPAVRGIFVPRGGFGLTRILDRIDYDALRRDPKVIVGYSDVTALHVAAGRRARRRAAPRRRLAHGRGSAG